MDLPWLYGKVDRNRAGVVDEKDGQVEGLGGLVQIEGKGRRAHLNFEVNRKEFSQNAASKQIQSRRKDRFKWR